MKNILLFSTGLSPQIVTESIYYHTQVRTPPLAIHEIHVITDARCKPLISNTLLHETDGWLKKLSADYSLDPENTHLPLENIHVLTDASGKPINDLLTVDENNAAVEQVFRIVKNLTKGKNTRLIASVAGGRKSMSVIVGQAMQFYAREQDLLTHVIVDDRIIGLVDFYYPTPKPRIVEVNGDKIDFHKVKIYLDEIPFIRLRPILGEFLEKTESGTLTSLVKTAQKQIEDLLRPVTIQVNLKKKELIISNHRVDMPAKNLAVYTLLLQCRRHGKNIYGDHNGYIAADRLLEETMLRRYLKIYSEIYSDNKGYVLNERDKIENPKKRDEFFTTKWLLETRSKINANLKKYLPPQIYAICQVQSAGSRNNTLYGIPAEPQNFRIE